MRERERDRDLPFMFSSQQFLPDIYFLNQSTENGKIFFGDFQVINWKSSWKYINIEGWWKMFSYYDNWQMNNKQKEEPATGLVGGECGPNNKSEWETRGKRERVNTETSLFTAWNVNK